MEVDLGSIQWCDHRLSCGPCNGPSHQRCQDFVVDRYLQSAKSHRCYVQPNTGINLQLCQNFVVDQYLQSRAIHRCCVQPSTASHRCCVQPMKAPASRAVRNLLRISTYYLKQTKCHRCCVQPSSCTNLQSCQEFVADQHLLPETTKKPQGQRTTKPGHQPRKMSGFCCESVPCNHQTATGA